MYKDKPTTCFDPNYKSYLCQNGVDLYLNQVTTTNDPITIYKKAALNYYKGNYKTALNFYMKILKPFHNNTTIFYNIHKAQLGLSGQYNELTLSFAPLDFYKKIKLDKRKSLRPSFLKKIKEKVISFFKLD